MKEPTERESWRSSLQRAAWTALVYSALTAARAQEVLARRKKERALQREEDRLRRKIESVWDALG